MEGSADLTEFFRSWKFDPDNQVRIIKADDGREVLQIRQPLGAEQYELDGRPDGLTPEGCSSYLEIFQRRLERHVEQNGSEAGFSLSHEEFQLLQNEGLLNYYRYLVLFQIGDFERTARDTGHNLQVCEMVSKFVESDEDKKEILQYQPYILRMHAIARAMVSLHRELKSAAKEILESAIEEIEKMPAIDTPAFQFERIRSLNYLRSTLNQVLEKKISPLDRLKQELDAALEEENYEQAAELRDRMRALKKELEL
jgi:hypothetical protein